MGIAQALLWKQRKVLWRKQNEETYIGMLPPKVGILPRPAFPNTTWQLPTSQYQKYWTQQPEKAWTRNRSQSIHLFLVVSFSRTRPIYSIHKRQIPLIERSSCPTFTIPFALMQWIYGREELLSTCGFWTTPNVLIFCSASNRGWFPISNERKRGSIRGIYAAWRLYFWRAGTT